MLRINQSVGKSVNAGFFAYTGKEVLHDPGSIFASVTNNLRMYGPDLRINIDEKVILNMQYVWRTDSQVYSESGGLPHEDVNTQGGFAEIIYAAKGDMSKWYFTGLYNLVNSDYNQLDYSSATFHVGYLLRRNMRVVGEYTHKFSGISYGKLSAGVITAF